MADIARILLFLVGLGIYKPLSLSHMAVNVITNMWYNNELPLFLLFYYDQGTLDMSNFEAWGYFSQIVWKNSTRIGCTT